ncbi:helix-turn-helix domain-containing protein [Nocardia carnea]|uniref:Helix-turn-helix domain-containing protein n=1 Tax=Nocardia carnea TaxID=37328 RepID=A0ABW7TRS6_9NOCA|nr:helix-turn-helix domain-containing protein [Nocardia carnea]
MATMGSADGLRVRSASALGRVVRAARKSRGMTQAELAELAQTNRYSLAQLEEGDTTKAIERLFDVLSALELELTVRPRHERTE